VPDLAVWPTDGADGSVSSEARWRKMARLWAGNGIAENQGGELAPTLAAGPTINVAIGAAWLDGHYAELAAPASVPASANGLLVVRFTPADNHAELVYRDGVTLPCYRWNRGVLVRKGHALSKVRPLSLEALAQYPIVTYDFSFTGRSAINAAFAAKGLDPVGLDVVHLSKH